MQAKRDPFAVYSSAQYGRQIQGIPCPCWRGKGAAQARRAAREAVSLLGGVAVVLGPGNYREVVHGQDWPMDQSTSA